MSKQSKFLVAGLMLGLFAITVAPAFAQMQEVKEKPRLYTYVALWNLPRAQWGEWQKMEAGDAKMMQDAIAKGTLVSYGDDVNLVHQPDQPTHDDWFQSMSMAGLMNVLDQLYKAGSASNPVLESSTKHWDNIYVSQYYNWRAGAVKDGYSHGSSYTLKEDAPNDAVELLAKSVIVPHMEKLLADGVISEYEIDEEAIHTASPGTFWVFWIASSPEALDKASASLRDGLKANRLISPAFDSMVNFKPHRDYLTRTNATYK